MWEKSLASTVAQHVVRNLLLRCFAIEWACGLLILYRSGVSILSLHCLHVLIQSFLVDLGLVTSLLQLLLLQIVDILDASDFINYIGKLLLLCLIIDLLSLCLRVVHTSHLLLLLSAVHLDIAPVKVILRHTGVVIELCPLVMLFRSELFTWQSVCGVFPH